MTLTKRVLKGSSWIFGLQLVQRGMRTSRAIILARLLAPKDFGLFGIASLMLLAFEVFTRTGIDDALIHTRDDLEPYLHTSYWIQVTRGIGLAIIILFSAPFAADFFDEPAVTPVIRTLALVVIVRGFRSIGVALLQRELNFRIESIYLSLGAIIEFSTTIILAYFIKNVWALIIGFLVGETALTVLSFIFHPYRPKIFFDVQKSQSLTKFGRWILLSGIVSYIALQLDNIMVGRWINIEALGLYQMAYYLANLPATEITKVINKVLGPAYAELQNNKERLMVAFKKSFSITIALVLPSAIGLMAASPIVVLTLLGKKWTEAIPLVSILSLSGLFRGFCAVSGSLFKASGVPHLIFQIELIRTIALVITIFPGFVFGGSIGIAGASVFSTIVMFVATCWAIFKVTGEASFLLESSLGAVIATALMAGVLFFFSSFVTPGWVELILLMVIGVCVYMPALVIITDSIKFFSLKLGAKEIK